MTIVNRFLYRLLRKLSAGAFNFAHGLQWLSLKAYDKSNYGSHRANKPKRKNYFTNGVGYAYDYLVSKYRELKSKAE